MISKTRPEQFNPKFAVVSCFVECDGKILLLHRQDHKPQGDTWGVPAGKVHSDDSGLAQALSREISEEIGLLINPPDLKAFVSYFVMYSDYDFTYHIFSIKLNKIPELKLNPEEHKDFTWVTPQDALKMNLIQDEDFCIKNFFKI